MALIFFLGKVFIISFSGAMQPGPVTATAITMGSRSRWAGALLAVGHGIVEFPLIVLMIIGLGTIFESNAAQIAIGFAGGAVLVLMAIQMFVSARANTNAQAKISRDRPILTGIVLSAGNPYFLVWWATVGLALATQAKGFGIWAFAVFAVVHWLVDLLWFGALSWASFKGSALLGPKSQPIVLAICSVALFGFGLYFIYNAADILLK